jgi:DNA processing protein
VASRASATGYTVISGGATGIDAAAHWGALHSTTYNGHFGAPTVAVFAGGLKNIGPSRNLRLFDEIMHHGGALVSELPPDSAPFAARFLARNRLIAALSSCVVVAQARYRSGALNTAQWAAEMGRVVLAIPGPIDSPMNAGCNRLIAEQKATILTDTNVVPLLPPHDYSDSDAQPSEQGSLFDAHDGHARTESNELGSVILTILQRHPLSRADLDAELTQQHSLKDVDDSHIGQALGLLELEGKMITSDSGLLTLPRH